MSTEATLCISVCPQLYLSLSRFGETFSVALDISKAFDRVWHKSLLSKLPSFGFYHSLCSFISSFLSDRCISAVVDGHCSSPKPINSGVPQGSVLSPTLFLLFISDLSVTNWPIHSYADDSTLHFLTSFDKRPTLQDLQDSRLVAAERITSDHSLISDWGKRNLVSFNASKNSNFPSIYSTQPSKLPSPILRQHTGIPFFNTKHPTYTYPLLKILTGNFTSLSLSQLPRSWAFCIVSASFSPPHSWCPYTGALSDLVWSTHHMCGRGPRTQLSLTIFSLLNSVAKLPLSLSSIVIFTLTALLNLLTACLSPPLLRPRCTLLSTQAQPCTVQINYARVNQHLHSFILVLVNSGTISLYLYFLLSTTWTISRGEC